jgi:spermidine/putrescine transport system substrate-binding protein
MARSKNIDTRLISQLAAQRTSRRRFLGRGAVALGAVAVGPAFLAACSSDDDSETQTSGTSGGGGSLDGTSLTIFNWPLYIENDDSDTSDTIKNFEDQTGVSVDYQDSIDSNDGFYTKYQPELAAGRGIGADIVVLTSWMAAQMITNGFLEEIDHANVPNISNLMEEYSNPDWDPGRKYTLPYATGQTAIGYWPDKVGGELDDMNVLFDPQYAGKVTILDEMRDSVGLTMLSMGFNPQTGTVDQANQAIEKISQARDRGQFKQITGNSYTEDLNLGDTWIAMAWSGDIASLRAENEDLQWLVPTQGAMRYTDNMMIPLQPGNQAGAEAWMNFLYDPAVSAGLFEAINYVSPVTGALEKMTPEAQESSFIQPPATPPLYEFMELTPDEDEELSTAFTEATQL